VTVYRKAAFSPGSRVMARPYAARPYAGFAGG